MKKGHIFLSLILMGFLFFSGCGGGSTGGAPGSDVGDTGIWLKSYPMSRGGGRAEDGHSLDVNLHLCPPDYTDYEPGLFEDFAVITIDATLVNSVYDTFPAIIEECTITYLKTDEDPSAPVIPSMTIYPKCPIIDTNENECGVYLMDIVRKTNFWDEVNSGLYDPYSKPTRYYADYKCKFYNNYGEEGNFQTGYEISLWDWDLC